MKKVLLIICVPLLLAISGISQNIVDSLITVLEKDKLDEKERLELLLELCKEINVNYRQYQAQSVIYAEEAIKLSENQNDHNSLAEAYLQMGNIYLAINYDTALFFSSKSKELFDELGNKDRYVDAIYAIASAFRQKGTYDTALVLYKATYEYYSKVSDFVGLRSSLVCIGIIESWNGNYNEALDNYKQALSYAEDEDDFKFRIIPLGNIAEVFFNQGSYDKALEYYFKSLKIAEILNDSTYLGSIYLNIGALYSTMYMDTLALDYFNKSLPITQKMNDKYNTIYILLNTGSIYSDWGKYLEAEKKINHALELAREIGYIGGIEWALSLLGTTAYQKGQYEEALEYYKESLSMLNNIQDDRVIAGKLYEIGTVNYAKGDYQEALNYYRNSHIKATSTGNLRLICIVDTCLSITYELLGNVDSALFYRKLYSIHQDSLVNTEKETTIADLQIQYETEKKEQQIALLEKDKQVQELQIQKSRIFNWALAGLVVIILLMALLFIRQNKLKNEHKSVMLEQKLLRLQMNPHFIFNALSNILVCMSKKNIESASNYLSSFSKLLRSTLESTRKENVFLDEEISSIKHYLELQKLSFEDKFEYSIEVDENIDPEEMAIPPMLIQPFIENAIQHGIRHKPDKGHIFIRFRLENKKVICEVEDNGVGREKAWEVKFQTNKEHKSLATNIIQDRIKSINRKMKQKINLAIIDLKSENNEPIGTRVVLDLPLN